MSDEQEIAKKVAQILRLLARKIEEKPDMLKDLALVIQDIPVSKKKKVQMPPVDFDIFHIFSDGGEQVLRQKLEPLELRVLKSIVRQHTFDSSKLAEKWKDKERVINLILERVSARSDKGKVFKEYP